MTAHKVTPKTITAILIATMAALVARAWLRVHLTQSGMDTSLAVDLSYIVVPLVLVALLFPLWNSEKRFLRKQFRAANVTRSLIFRAVAVGLLLRLIWWTQLIAGVSFGFYSNNDLSAQIGPNVSVQCSSLQIVFLGIFVLALLAPVIEEVVHRAYVQTALQNYPAAVSILVSATFFTILHNFSSWPFTFLAGIVFAIQYWSTRSLWSSLCSHMTVNGLIQFDWRCISVQWNPAASETPIWAPGIVAGASFLVASVLLVKLLKLMITGAHGAPR